MYTGTQGSKQIQSWWCHRSWCQEREACSHQGPNRQELALRARQERQTHIEVNKMFIIHYNLNSKQRFFLFTYLYIISNYHCRNLFQIWKQRDSELPSGLYVQSSPPLLWTYQRQWRVGIQSNHGQGAALHQAGASAHFAEKCPQNVKNCAVGKRNKIAFQGFQ